MALAVKDALIAVWIVGEEELVQGLERPRRDGDGGRTSVEMSKSGIYLCQVAAKIHGIQLDSELPFPQWDNGGGSTCIFVVVDESWYRIRILVIVEEIRSFFKDLSSLVLCPSNSGRKCNSRVRVAANRAQLLDTGCQWGFVDLRLDVEVGDHT